MQPTTRLSPRTAEEEIERAQLRLVPVGDPAPDPVALLEALRRRPAGAERQRAADRLRTLARIPANERLLRSFATALHAVSEGRDPLEAALALVEAAAPRAAPAALLVGPDAAWFEAPGAPRADLRRRGVLRLFLRALVEERLRAPGTGLSQERLVEVGWPGEQIRPTAAAARVYTSIRMLRALGLGDRLRTHADGYLIDPALPVRRAEPQPPADV